VNELTKAVFLSYASQDVESARRIAEALRAFGVEVWFDQSELRGGDAWDQKIRTQIHECALFLAIISKNTDARSEGYFRREWKLAIDRTHDMAEGVPFIVPVVVDDIHEASALVPAQFQQVQWMRLPGALPSPQFVEQVKRLLTAPRRPTTAGPKADPGGHAYSPVRHSNFPMRTVIALGMVVLALVTYIVVRPSGKAPVAPPKPIAEAKPAPVAPVVNDKSAPADKSIAVLPFKNLSDEKDTGYFADGVQEDILTSLQNVREFRVVSRQSTEQFRTTDKAMPQIGRELAVAYLVEGSVRKAGNRVRVSVQLIEAATDRHLWSPPPYDRNLNDIFALQSEIAKTVAGELKVALSPQEKALIERRPTENLAAYDLYMKARDVLIHEGIGRTSLLKQESLLQSAVTLDPKFAGAWAQLGSVHGMIYGQNVERTDARRAKAKAALDTAVRLAPDAPETLLALVDNAFDVHRDWEQVIARGEQFARLQPNNPRVYWNLGVARLFRSEWAEAAALSRKTTQLDPGSQTYATEFVRVLRECRRYGDALEEQRRRIGLSPNSDAQRRNLAMLPFMASGSTKEMDDWLAGLSEDKAKSRPIIEMRKVWARTRGDLTEAIRLDRLQPYSGGDLSSRGKEMEAFDAAVTLAAAGDVAGAHARLGDLPEKMRAQLVMEANNADLLSRLGRMEALVGNKEEAVRFGRRAIELFEPALVLELYGLASTYAWAGDKDRAIAELERLMPNQYTPNGMSVYHLKFGPWFFPLRSDPRFEALLNDPKNNAPLF